MESQQRRGGLVAVSPSQTPRSSDKPVRDLRSADSNSNSNKYDKDKGVNVQVLLRCRWVILTRCWVELSLLDWLTRWLIGFINVMCVLFVCRPLSEDEMRVHTPVVISCNESRREVSAVQNIANKQIDRTFAFDKVIFIFIFCSFFIGKINPITYMILFSCCYPQIWRNFTCRDSQFWRKILF